MLNTEPGKPLGPGDLIGDKAARLGIARNDGRAGCLCHVYAHVLGDIAIKLGASKGEDGEIKDDGPENKKAIENMKKAIIEIHREFSYLKENGKIKESCPEEYSAALDSDVTDLIPKLELIIPRLKSMEKIYDIAKQEPSEHPEQLDRILSFADRYESYLLECRPPIIAVIIKIKWWCEKLPPPGCQRQKAAGDRGREGNGVVK